MAVDETLLIDYAGYLVRVRCSKMLFEKLEECLNESKSAHTCSSLSVQRSFPMTTRIPVLAVLQNRDFRALWTARWIHEVARRMEILVLGYLIFELTNSPFQVGLIAVCLNASRPVLSLYVGLLADRLDRQRILVGVQITYLGLAAVILTLLMVEVIQPWHAFVMIFLQGSARAVDDPSRRIAILDLAGQERLANAMSLETITNNVGKILGPIAGGVLISKTGFMGAYGVLVGLDLAALLFICRLRLPNKVAIVVCK